MPKKLYLLRHAEAAAKEARQEDKARELTQTGVKHALHMGAWFRDQRMSFDVIISSSAVRAEQTAALAAEALKVEHPKILLEDTLYEASVRQLLDYVNNIEDGYSEVLLVGHNPGISYLAEYLTKADIGDMVAGSVAIIAFEFSSWKNVSENSGVLAGRMTPELIGSSQ